MSHTLSMDFISCVKGDYLIQKVSNASHSKRAWNGVNWPLRHYCRPKRTMVTKEEISYKFLCDFKPHNSQTLNTLSRIVIKRRQTRRSGNGTQQKWKLTKKNRKLKKIIFIAFSSPSPQKREKYSFLGTMVTVVGRSVQDVYGFHCASASSRVEVETFIITPSNTLCAASTEVGRRK